MFGPYRQELRRPKKTWFTFFVVLAMIVWPVGQPMPVVPGSEAAQTSQLSAMNFAQMFGALTEDDLEVEHHDFTLPEDPVREALDGSVDSMSSFLWTERLHRPPIT